MFRIVCDPSSGSIAVLDWNS